MEPGSHNSAHHASHSHRKSKDNSMQNESFMKKDPGVLLEGWLKKRGTRIPSLWADRYFVLKGDQILYYIKPGDPDPKGAFFLDRSCLVSEVKALEKKKYHVFRILWPDAVDLADVIASPQEPNETQGTGVGPSLSKESSLEIKKGGSSQRHSADYGVQQSSPNRQSSGLTTNDVVTQRRSLQKEQQQDHPEPSNTSAGKPVYGVPHKTSVDFRKVPNAVVSKHAVGGPSGSNTSSKVGVAAMTVGGVVGGVALAALTAGVALVPGLVIVGVSMAAGGGASVIGASSSRNKQVSLVLASESKEVADEWKDAIEAQIRWHQGFSQSRWISMVGLERRLMPVRRKAQAIGKPTSAATHLTEVDRWTRSVKWTPYTVHNGIRIYELDNPTMEKKGKIPCRKVQVTVRATPLETFITLVSIPCRIANGLIASTRIIERLDDHSDVIYMSFKPIFLWPTWTAPRDFCLVRYWRYDEDGTYIICFDSTVHQDCPHVPDHVRADLHAVYTISPKKHMRNVEFDDSPECLLTHIIQLNPRGWIWSSLGYFDKFVSEALLQVLDIRDLLETDRFMAAHIDTTEEEDISGENESEAGGKTSTLETYKITLPAEMWANMDGTDFVVRGPSYNIDKVKVPSAKAPFRLLAVDLFDLNEPIDNIGAHPNNRMQAATKKGDAPPFTFIMQLQFPGPERHFGYVCYFAPEDPNLFEDETNFSRLLKSFFFENDDVYRDNRFKLIPKIVEGNFIVRKSVGSTPAILGTKLKQNYYKGSNYFELDVNIASSSVAAGVVRLAAGYAKTLVVDLALVVQGETQSELPEGVFCAWRIKFMDLGCAKKIE